jgi:ATP-dependent DNA ligase
MCLSEDGRPQFSELLHRRGEPYFCAFDLLWLNGEDLRALPTPRKKKTPTKADSAFEEIPRAFQ